ncbi:MAG: pseudouridine synthase [Lachnospiraceae bacterium]
MSQQMRLDRFLVEMGCGSRSQVKEMVRRGRVRVDDTVAMRAEQKVDINQHIYLDGQLLIYQAYEYYMLNKPAGVLSAANDKKCRTVVDLIVSKKRKDLFPVGRLDKDTEGLLLITNDGDLAHQLLSPKKHINKTYYVEVNKPIPENAKGRFLEGMDLGDFTSMPAYLEVLSPQSGRLTIQEGKFHQVKRMFEAVGVEVVYLKRLSMGSLQLDESLQAGEYRALTENELELLKAGKTAEV